ncbi:hypothetical protein CR513_47772, partial [Mucuna pruriens]
MNGVVKQRNYTLTGINVKNPKARVEKYTLLKATRAKILKEVYHFQLLDIPPPTKWQIGPSWEEWCKFLRACDHTIEECRVLKSQIEKLIQDGYLGCFVKRKENERRTIEELCKRDRS